MKNQLRNVLLTALTVLAAFAMQAQPLATKAVTVDAARTLPEGFRPVPVMAQDGAAAPVFSAVNYLHAQHHAYPSPLKAKASKAPLMACVLSSLNWPTYNSAVGIYQLPTDGVPTSLEAETTNMKLYANGSSVYANGLFYANNYIIYEYNQIIPATYVFDADTWEMIGVLDGDITGQGTCMAYDPLSDKVFGCFYSASGTMMNFGEFNTGRGISTSISRLTTAWSGCAVSPQGVLYAIDMDGKLFTVDKTNGNMTLVGDTGLKPRYLSSATIDPYTGTFYYVCTSGVNKSYLYEINPETAAATLLYEMPGGEQVAGLFVPTVTSSVDAPAAPENFMADFTGASLSGTITFTSPASSFSGTEFAANEALTYTVRVNNVDYKSGSTTPGAEVSVPVTVAAPGSYDFSAVVSNEDGTGPKAKVVKFVGTDEPPMVKNVVLTTDGTDFTLTWDAITTGVNGGFIDPATLSYTVVRMPDNVVVADGTKVCTFSEAVPEEDGVKAYYYTVSATADGTVTQPVESNSIVIGAFQTPYSETFDTQESFDTYTCIDANDDAKNWQWLYYNGYQEGVVRIAYSTADKDDWLITPPIYLEGGKQYEFSFGASSASASSWAQERVEAYVGREATVVAMTTRLVDPTDILTANVAAPKVLKADFVAPETGLYSFGIHAITPANGYYLNINSVAVSEPRSAETPAAVTDLVATPDYDGNLTAKLTFTAPSLTASGAAIEALEKVVITRDGASIATLTGILPGQAVTYEDKAESITRGTHTYTVTAFNSEGQGNVAEVSVYIGPAVPAAPLEVKATLTDKIGEIALSWTPSPVDASGNKINPALVKFQILTTNTNGQIISVVDDLSTTSYTYQAVAENAPQRLMNWAIVAYNEAGSNLIETDIVAVGNAYTMPFNESFTDHTASHVFGMTQYDEEQYSSWGYYSDASFDDTSLSIHPVSQDEDNGFVGYTATAIDATSGLRSGRIAVNAEQRPILSFWHLVTSENNTNVIDIIIIKADGTETVVKTIRGFEELNVGAWEHIVVPLDSYSGQEIYFEIRVQCKGYAREFFDNIQIYNQLSNNLHAKALVGSMNQTVGKGRRFTAYIENYGLEKATGYTVELLRNGKISAVVNGPEIDPGDKATVAFTQDFTVLDPETLKFSARIVYEDDEMPSDNETPEISCNLILPKYPTPTQLKAVETQNGISLVWTHAAESHMTPVATIEDFESYGSWETESVGRWTLVDRDQHLNGQTEELSFPAAGQKTSFFVFDNADETYIPSEYREGFAAYSGNKMMASMFPKGDTGSMCDDWLISPELTGDAQSVSFYARSYHPAYLETFQFWISGTGTDPDDFKLVSEHIWVPNVWTQYTYDLSKGVKYFAIRCISNDRLLFMVDNVTMIEKSGPVDIATRVGYNIYRDGKLLNAEPVTEAQFVEQDAKDDGQSYVVATVYDKGESRPSNVATVDPSGLEDINSAAYHVYAKDGQIVVANAGGKHVAIFSTDGKVLLDTPVASDIEKCSASAGIYLVKVNNATFKVILR